MITSISLIGAAVIGVIAAWLAGRLMRGNGFGLLGGHDRRGSGRGRWRTCPGHRTDGPRRRPRRSPDRCVHRRSGRSLSRARVHGSPRRTQDVVMSSQRVSIPSRTRARLLRLSRRVNSGGLHRCAETMTLDQLEDSHRPLLFSLLPRMLGPDGTTPSSLQRTFEYADQSRDRAPAIIISSQRWSRALATSRRLAARRARDGKP